MDFIEMDDKDRTQSKFVFMDEVAEVGPLFKVGVVGATGLVGKTLIQLLRQRRFPVDELHIYASSKSEGHWIGTPYGQLCLERLNKKKPPLLDLVFMAAGSAVAREWGWRFAHRGAKVIDKSSYFRDKSYAPLVVPEVNVDALKDGHRIIANPNCTTIPLVMALKPLHDVFSLQSFTAVSFQSVTGSGGKGMMALEQELQDEKTEPSIFQHRIAHNVIPWIGNRRGNFSGEEIKMIYESRKILGLPRLPVRITAVRIPIMIGHSLAIHADFRRPVSVERAHDALSGAAGVVVEDDPENGKYPMPLNTVGRDEVMVGRIRRDRGRHSLALWVSNDNLRKGAATNAVQIAELLISLNSSE